MENRPGALAAIGKTPVARLSSFGGPEAAEIWVKLEAANPTGSYKDRMALAMIEGAEARGELQPGQTVVEYTGGSTGSSLAFVCSIKGYPLRIVSSNAFAEEKLLTMRAFGADLELIHSDEGIHPDLIPQMQARAAEIVEQEGAFPTDQFNNLDTLDGYLQIGRELVEQIDGEIHGWPSMWVSVAPTSERAAQSASVGPTSSAPSSSPKNPPSSQDGQLEAT